MNHICTNESLTAGAPAITLDCPICFKRGDAQVGYVVTMYAECGHAVTHDHFSGIVRQRRNLLNLSRRQIAEKLGLTRKTISNYENIWPSRKYWNATAEMVRAVV